MQPGDVLDGRYQLIGQIGEGAFGAVWKARDARIQRHVAVKVMLQGGGTAKDAARFAREVATAGALNHPHIVTVHDFGQHLGGDRPLFYLVMELLDGAALDVVLRRGLPALPDALGWAAQIAEALVTAHRAGVVHRDIKPANVMIQSGGSVKVVDFGIARAEAADDGLTSTNVIVGTPAYMAPERFDGKPLDARSDLYAFGCLLNELCTGQPPFRGGIFELIRQHGQVPPQVPSSLRPGLPGEVDRLVLELLAKDPARRPSGADQVLARLRDIHRRTTTPAAAHTPTVRDTGSDVEYVRTRREEADALFEETRSRAAQAAADFEANLVARREQSERDLAARQAKAEKRLADIELRAEQLRLEAEKLRADVEQRARRSVETARRESEDIVAEAGARADRIRSESERELAVLVKRRDSINAQLTDVRELLATLTGRAVEAAQPPAQPPEQQY